MVTTGFKDPEDDLCIHELPPFSCSICKHGPTPRVEEAESERSVQYCRSCEAEIVWVITENGKPMPIDAEPGGLGPKGEQPRFRKERVEMVDGKKRKIVHFVKDNEMEANTRPLYHSHFVTCPDADEHRKGK